MPKERAIKYCNRVIAFSLCAAAFYIPISTALIESFAGLSIFAWLVKKFIERDALKNSLKNNFLTFPALFYFFICLLSSIFSSNQALSFRHLILKTLEYLLIFFIAAEAADRKFLRNIVIVLVVSAGLVGIDGIFQYFTNYDFFRGRTPVIAGRINGPFTAPTDFANYVVSLLPLVICLSFVKFKKNWIKPILIIISAVLFACLVLSASRSAWAALFAAIAFAGIFLGRKKIIICLVVLALLILGSIFLQRTIAKDRIAGLFNSGYYKETLFCDRPHLLETGYNMFIGAPVLGQGLGTFMYNFNEFRPAVKNYRYGEGPSYAHNCFLQIAAETGLAGLFSFLLIIVVLFSASLRSLKKAGREGFYYYAFSGLNIGILAYLISSFFDTNLYSLPLAVLFWLMLGLAVAAKNTTDIR